MRRPPGAVAGWCKKRCKEFRPATREEELSQWKSWSWELENYLVALDPGFKDDFDLLKQQTMPVDLADMDAPVRHRSVLLFSVLAGLLHEKGKQVLKAVEPQNGYEGYRRLRPG